jgi:hypothetical protein
MVPNTYSFLLAPWTAHAEATSEMASVSLLEVFSIISFPWNVARRRGHPWARAAGAGGGKSLGPLCPEGYSSSCWQQEGWPRSGRSKPGSGCSLPANGARCPRRVGWEGERWEHEIVLVGYSPIDAYKRSLAGDGNGARTENGTASFLFSCKHGRIARAFLLFSAGLWCTYRSSKLAKRKKEASLHWKLALILRDIKLILYYLT